MKDGRRDVPHIGHDRIGIFRKIDDVPDGQMDHHIEYLLIHVVERQKGNAFVIPVDWVTDVGGPPHPEIALMGRSWPLWAVRWSRMYK